MQNKQKITNVFKKWYFWLLFVLMSAFNTPWWALELTPSRIAGALLANFIISLIVAIVIFWTLNRINRTQ